MTRRPAATLIEVLVAIFVMAIGMLALLTLFPLGALRMALAIQDEKAAQAVANASAIAIAHDVRNDMWAIRQNPGEDAYVNPTRLGGATATMPDADPFGPSYPVFIDPIGIYASPAGAQQWVGGVPGVLRRREPNFDKKVSGAPAQMKGDEIFRWFTLWDDITYDPDNPGEALALSRSTQPRVFIRDTRFSWAYLCQRPRAGDPTLATCSVVVFNKRPLALGASLLLPEHVYTNRGGLQGTCPSYFDTVNNYIYVDYGNHPLGAPTAQAGDWIMDATPDRVIRVSDFNQPPPVNVQRWRTIPVPHAYCYRIVGVTDPAPNAPQGRSMVQYEVAGPIRGFDKFGANLLKQQLQILPNTDPTVRVEPVAGDSATLGYVGTTIFLEGVVEVFEKGTSRLP